MSRILRQASIASVVLGVVTVLYLNGRSLWVPVYQRIVGKRTVAEVIEIYGPEARERMRTHFDAAEVPYPPERVTLLAIKNTSVLELWVETEFGPKFIRGYSVKAQSGGPGPKLREGDRQIPEGLYRVEGLNPNSSYHLSMKLSYPNAFDRKHAAAEGRDQPGTNIFIHGKAVSVGCLAMGDRAIEELFTLAADVGIDGLLVAIAPTDPRIAPLDTPPKPLWAAELYDVLTGHFAKYRRPEN